MACEECLDNGTLSGGIIDIAPEVPCLGDTLTFTVREVTDDGGIKRVDCYAKTAVPPVVPSYTWVLTRPGAPPLSGSGASAAVVADLPGNYSCTFTATANRECPPPQRTFAPTVAVVAVSAPLTLNPSNIPANSNWPGMPPVARSDITVQWDPPQCEDVLQIVLVEPQGDYVPAGQGSLEHIGANLWRYFAFDEPQTEKCADPVKVWIAALQNGIELPGRKSILVQPVHTFFTTGANADFQMDYDFLRWNYAAVLATTGGMFSSVTIGPDVSVYCGVWPFGKYGYACTNVATGAVSFGTSTFAGSENQAASIIGHELVHASGVFSECTTYTWEFNSDATTGIFQCDTTYLAEVVQHVNCECNGVGCP